MNITQHMSIQDYFKATGQDHLVKVDIDLGSKVDVNPLEKVECERFAGKLTELVNTGLIVKFSHIANESDNPRANKRNQRVGVRAGCPDFVIVLKDKVVFVEMKRVKGGTVSIDQKQWIDAINQAGGYARVCKGSDEAIKYVGELL